MQKTKIEWVRNPDGTQGYSWNPISGICTVGCWYCYAKRIYKRFKLIPEIHWHQRTKEINKIYGSKKPMGIFVCSTMELFHPQISDRCRDWIFHTIKKNPQHRFYILTKFPQNIDRPMPPNVWLGVTVEDPVEHHERVHDLVNAEAKIKFVSFEPLLAPYYHSIIPIKELDWVIVGRLTGHGKKYDPTKKNIERIAEDCRLEFHTPLFLKNNLQEIWGEPLIQGFPDV